MSRVRRQRAPHAAELGRDGALNVQQVGLRVRQPLSSLGHRVRFLVLSAGCRLGLTGPLGL